METARDRFFNTPELLNLVTTTLGPTDISRLCRTSPRIHESCTSSLYRDLYISGCYRRDTSPEPILVNRHASSAVTTPVTHWLPPEDYRFCRIVPVPPITNLQSLELTRYTDVNWCYNCRIPKTPEKETPLDP
ncbi:MAG: hypothetical protein JOS17DRAFT_790569 [Linnemannia elongata]|nr:MAG: hypothetical protein JOS17DRAFT_790569 [Linnemannia elongata]